MSTFVLVHGGWHGEWCWSRVVERLAAAGHRVFAPTLSGVGERTHLFSGNINLTTHVDDVASVLRWNDLDGVVLCGHSYGGFVISGAVERETDRIKTLVYLDAFVPNDGEALFDLVPEAVRARHLASAGRHGGIAVAPLTGADFHAKEENRAIIDAKSVPHPIGSFTEKITLTGARDRIAWRTYVRASGFPSIPYDRFYKQYSGALGWSTYEIPTSGHDAMLDDPEAVAEILLAEAARL